MRRKKWGYNKYPATCAKCKKPVGVGQGKLYWKMRDMTGYVIHTGSCDKYNKTENAK